jgi:hypothetical protein
VPQWFSPKEVFDAHIRILKREMRNYCTFTDYLSLERWVDDNYQWMLEQTDFQKAQAYADDLKRREEIVVEKERHTKSWDYRVNSLCDYIQDVKRLIGRGNPDGAVEILNMLPYFARTGRFYPEEKKDEAGDTAGSTGAAGPGE